MPPTDDNLHFLMEIVVGETSPLHSIVEPEPTPGVNECNRLFTTVSHHAPARLSLFRRFSNAARDGTQHSNLHGLSIVRRVKVVLKVVEGCKCKNHNGGWKCQTPHDSHGLRPIRRGKEEETSE